MDYASKVMGFLLLLAALLLQKETHAQEEKKKISLKDSLDHAVDLSDYIIDANGFIPVPTIITEPALGGFGGALAPIFLKKQPPFRDTVNGKLQIRPVMPDITGAMGMYTVNGSWAAFASRAGMIRKLRLKYSVGGGYANINMDFYRTFDQIGEKQFSFNFKTVPIFLQGIRQLGSSNWFAGLKYLYLKTDVNYNGTLPSFVKPEDMKSQVSQLGLVTELDNRDNIFTPDAGIKLHFDANLSDNIFGSDFYFWKLNYYGYFYKPISKKLIGGLRVDGQQALGDPPFYLLPYINLRGVPTMRYQGRATILTELEARWDFYKRWSIIGFGGTGKAFDDWSDFGSASLVYSYGTGFRYLMARKFGLRMGIDIAHSPGTWAYYIVFGSNWLK